MFVTLFEVCTCGAPQGLVWICKWVWRGIEMIGHVGLVH